MENNGIDPTLVTVGQPCEGGCVYVTFDENATIPTDAATTLDEEWESVGEISENGFTDSENISSITHKGWHGTPMLTTVDSEESTFKLEMLEVSRPTAAKVRYGANNVEVDENGDIKHISKRANQRKPIPVVVEELESNGFKRRTVFKKAMVSSLDDIAHKKGDLMVYGMTFTALDDGETPYDIYRAKPATDSKEPTETNSYPEGTPDDSWTVLQIEAYATDKGIDLTGCTNKAEKLAAVTATE